ncbi:uncharacterized protein EV422DRAFT_533686 [Fimicolochytrium jonesii]|uniref:uncharacterized protein n=1 Tax=Fimicolochytrium jonesii TaxID=1396493 RepID=UPI0022FF16E0|nr:uncharacterized protein EV422DRAFT_533686 [Fimicolochytrium jonesii]KAI8819627.1 hypothetical protein EV422DRAFT_533686 [Fimicolochytrium jonesii]
MSHDGCQPMSTSDIWCDYIIAVAYFALPLQLFHLCQALRNVTNTSHKLLLALFVLFILLCGVSHALSALRLSKSLILLLTSVVSVAAAIATHALGPHLIKLVSTAHFELSMLKGLREISLKCCELATPEELLANLRHTMNVTYPMYDFRFVCADACPDAHHILDDLYLEIAPLIGSDPIYNTVSSLWVECLVNQIRVAYHFAFVLDFSPDIILKVDTWGKVCYRNKRWREFNSSGVELRDSLPLVHPDDRDAVMETWGECIKKRTNYFYEYRMLHDDGTYHWIQSNCQICRSPVTHLTHWYGVIRDINQSKILTEEVMKQKAFLQTVLNAVPIALVVAKYPEGRKVITNPTAVEFANEKDASDNNENCKGFRAGIPIAPGDWPLDQTVRTGIPVEPERIDMRHGDGTVRHWNVSTLMIYEKGHPTHVVGLAHDQTLLYEMQEKLDRFAQASMAAVEFKSRMMANISHELRTPMNAIMGLITMVQDDTTLPSSTSVTIKETLKSCKSLSNLIENLLGVSAGPEPMVQTGEEFKILPVIHDVLRVYANQIKERSIQVVVPLTDEVQESVYHGRRDGIEKALSLLVDNAVKFNSEGGTVIINAEHDGKRLRLTVSDTGIGISPENQQKMYEIFWQADNAWNRQYTGAGIGLSICKQLVESMRGTLSCESVIGQGTLFRLLIPLHRMPPAASEPESLHILVAEDNKINQIITKKLLIKLGHTVDVVENGKLAVEAYNPDTYDLVLMDLHMPVCDGFCATKRIRQNEKRNDWRHVPIIAFTAGANFTQAEFMASGLDDIITKPNTNQDMGKIILKWWTKCKNGLSTSNTDLSSIGLLP